MGGQGAFGGIVGVVSSGIGGFNLGGVGGILSVVAAKAGLKAMAI